MEPKPCLGVFEVYVAVGYEPAGVRAFNHVHPVYVQFNVVYGRGNARIGIRIHRWNLVTVY